MVLGPFETIMVTTIATAIVTVTISGFYYYLTGRDIARSHERTTEKVAKHLHVDIDKTIQAIRESGEETRKTIMKNSEETLKAIRESHHKGRTERVALDPIF